VKNVKGGDAEGRARFDWKSLGTRFANERPLISGNMPASLLQEYLRFLDVENKLKWV
jgi:hypothetical protein